MSAIKIFGVCSEQRGDTDHIAALDKSCSLYIFKRMSKSIELNDEEISILLDAVQGELGYLETASTVTQENQLGWDNMITDFENLWGGIEEKLKSIQD